jgi:hypothetical protein
MVGSGSPAAMTARPAALVGWQVLFGVAGAGEVEVGPQRGQGGGVGGAPLCRGRAAR